MEGLADVRSSYASPGSGRAATQARLSRTNPLDESITSRLPAIRSRRSFTAPQIAIIDLFDADPWESAPSFARIDTENLSCQLGPEVNTIALQLLRAGCLRRASKDTPALVRSGSSYLQTGPASAVNVLLSENQLFTAIEGAP